MKYDGIARDNILSLKAYVAGAQRADTIRLNANEAPASHWPASGKPLNRYPEVHPVRLQARLARLFDVDADNLLVTRGSSEAIDLLIRSFCRADHDTLIISPPTFEMYRFYADIQSAGIINVPLVAENDFMLDPGAVLASCADSTKLVFICSPNNPTGTMVPENVVDTIATRLEGRAIVVVDEAYVEFANRESLAKRATGRSNIVVLRTLSKAHALAGARCGAAIASSDVIDVLRKVLPPYSFPTPVIECVMAALAEDRLSESADAVASIVQERERLIEKLAAMPCVERSWQSHANFILVRFRGLRNVLDELGKARILIRDFSSVPGLDECARITIGTAAENDQLLDVLSALRSSA